MLYFGDSLWADLVEARKLHGWTTGAIIYDVELELEKMMSPVGLIGKSGRFAATRSSWEVVFVWPLRTSTCLHTCAFFCSASISTSVHLGGEKLRRGQDGRFR